MAHGTLIIPNERGKHFVTALGTRCNVQIEDMNAVSNHRRYRKTLQRLEEMERLHRFLEEELIELGVNIERGGVDDFLDSDRLKLDDVESDLKIKHAEFTQFRDNNNNMRTSVATAVQETAVMQLAQKVIMTPSSDGFADAFEETAGQGLIVESQVIGRPQDPQQIVNRLGFSNISGVIPLEESANFGRSLFRTTRGNAYVHFEPIDDPLYDPKSGNLIRKSVFVIFYQGQNTSYVCDKIERLCRAFNCDIYNFPTNAREATEKLHSLNASIAEKQNALSAFERYVVDFAADLVKATEPNGLSKLENYRLFCMMEKGIYFELNKFEGDLTLRATVWYPLDDEYLIRSVLQEQEAYTDGRSFAMLVNGRRMLADAPDLEAGRETGPALSEKDVVFPTYVKSNAWLTMSQQLIDTYGVPRYQEINPALFTAVTFPFLFGVMYGDVGHGSIIFAFGLFLVRNAEMFKENNRGLYDARYFVMTMGLFAIYCGFVYNDMMSLGFNFFSSRWEFPPFGDSRTVGATPVEGLDYPYPFGLDSAWLGAANELTFVNSLKMKMSVLLGVTQMMVGILLSFGNAINFGSKTDLICECVPKLAFMSSFFGYLCWMIMFKWTAAQGNYPSLTEAIINMVMLKESKQPLYEGNTQVETKLMLIILISVPWLFCLKPVVDYISFRRQRMGVVNWSGHVALRDSVDLADVINEDGQLLPEPEFDFGEVFIHQAIESIEFVLGSISHTASYLRLWALSLAHMQLSKVFFEKILLMAFQASFPMNIVYIYLAAGVFVLVSFGILSMMDSLECFLHALRLHWVEFQSKFYKADGIPFTPFSIPELLRFQE